MSCAAEVVVSEIGCSVVQVATPGPQGIQGQAGSGSFTTPSTVGALPVSPQGTRAIVTDATLATFYSAAVGGGSIVVPVFFDGSVWRIG